MDAMKEMGPADVSKYHWAFKQVIFKGSRKQKKGFAQKHGVVLAVGRKFQFDVMQKMDLIHVGPTHDFITLQNQWWRGRTGSKRNSSQEHVVAYSQLQHFKFEEGHLMEALEELREPWLKGK